ncbi:hypothetical protein RvY_11000 [Ramazzottius varieornatus]|uniref:Protein quiver n=1 Tax=Ramazzottius varieornatus TaxID=947166 RepID=A0A1D1VMG3_RAMVA|nr:hypothetical protein RvY_11000 [Ramazzottius varieornatus]
MLIPALILILGDIVSGATVKTTKCYTCGFEGNTDHPMTTPCEKQDPKTWMVAENCKMGCIILPREGKPKQEAYEEKCAGVVGKIQMSK